MKKNIRKYIALILAAVSVLLLLAACGRQTEPAQAKPEAAAQLANPMQEVTAEEQVQKAGLRLYAPSGAEDIHYYTITDGDKVVAQVDFLLNGKAYTHRACYVSMDAQELSGIYFTKATESFAQVSYCEGKIITEGKTSVLFWEDVVPGVCYTVSCTDCENPIVLLEIAEDVFVPLQDDGTGYAEIPTEYPDLEGRFENEEGVVFEAVPAGMHIYDVKVNIPGLPELTGEAKLDTISMDMTLEAPDGSSVFAEFYSREDGSCTLIISESEWDGLVSETEFNGFVRNN